MGKRERGTVPAMRKTLSYRLFGLGGIPDTLRALIEAEGPLVVDEGVPGRLMMNRVAGPGQRHRGRTEGFSGFLAVTRCRILAYSYRKRQINIGVDDPRLADLYVRLTSPDILAVSFESSLFREGWSGVMEFRFLTDKAVRFHEELLKLGLRQGRAPAA